MRFDRGQFDERWGAWAMAALVGAALGTVAHFILTGRVYYFNAYPVGVAGWAWLIATRGPFLVLSRSSLAKAGWGLVTVVAVLAALTAPIQAAATVAWWAEGLATVVAGALVFVGLPREAGRPWAFRIAGAVLVVAWLARLTTLRLYDESLSTTVLRLQ